MKRLAVVLMALGTACAFAGEGLPSYKKLTITEKFYCEGAYHADFNKDGKLDVVSGPFWYEGPDFQKSHEVRPPKAVDPKGYSDNFLTYTGDFNGDGWPDIFYCPFPGAAGSWFENPQGKEGHWKAHRVLKAVDNESPMWGDINKDGKPELIFNMDGFFGYAVWDPAKPDAEWTFVPVTPKGGYGKFQHGIGFGDVNGDGRNDLLEASGWWEQPADAKPGDPWKKHPFQFGPAPAQMFTYDIDGDGLNDVLTAWHCHQYGLVWYKQAKDDKGEIAWKQNVILPPKPDVKSDALRISQLHGFDLADVNGDGVLDVLTGKRFWAHGPGGDAEPSAPAVVYWFVVKRDPDKRSVEFTPLKVDDNSGVGTQVAAADLNGDKVPDVIVGNKKGTFIFLSEPAK